MLPKDVNMLLSYINMGLRDKYEDLDDMASSEDFDVKETKDTLKKAGFIYSKELKKFVQELKDDGGKMI
ncbi:MAG: DUF4250 domain-containing protein [Lachnospiraceae bacterium]|nr:DUF4250 domain-containing protein [Lachnospiraceae bacterium]